MQDVLALQVLSSLLSVLLAASIGVTLLLGRFTLSVMRDRDGWRDVAQRALVVAQLGRTVTRRAANLTTRTSR